MVEYHIINTSALPPPSHSIQVRLEPLPLNLMTSHEGRTFMLQAKLGKKTNIVNLFAKILGLKKLSEVNSPKICVYLQYSELTDWQQREVF